MKRFVPIVALVLALCATPVLAAKGDKAARAAKRQEAGGVAGVVMRVQDGVITLQTRGKQAGEAMLKTDAGTKFQGVASAADIKPGMRLMATASGGTAQTIKVAPEGKGKPKGKGAGKGPKKNAK